jgi:hypothetical protein
MLLSQIQVSISILGGENQALKRLKNYFWETKIKCLNWPVMV